MLKTPKIKTKMREETLSYSTRCESLLWQMYLNKFIEENKDDKLFMGISRSLAIGM